MRADKQIAALRWSGGLTAGSTVLAAVLVAANRSGPTGVVGSVLLAVLCAGAVGALIGFLFGIPRALSSATAANAINGSGFSHNTNLEQISDWLTKIMVGVGLTQANAIAVQVRGLATASATAWGWKDGAVIAGFLLVGSMLLGFLASYIWTRTEFIIFLERNQSAIDTEVRGRLKAVETERDEAQAKAKEAMATAEQTATKLQNAVEYVGGGPVASPSHSRRGFDSLGAISRDERAERDAQAIWDSDPNKGTFGGSATANGKQLSAEVTPLAEDGALCGVRLRVVATGDTPLQGLVRFHLHPTFSRPTVDVPTADGVAELKIISAGSFTVGAETEDGTRLELDLAQLPGIPDAFRDA